MLFVCLFPDAERRKTNPQSKLGSKSCCRSRKGLKQPLSIPGSESVGCSARAAPASAQSPIEPGQDRGRRVCRAVVTPQACSFHSKDPARPAGSSHRVRRLCQPTAPCLFLFLKTTRHTGEINTKSPWYVRSIKLQEPLLQSKDLKNPRFLLLRKFGRVAPAKYFLFRHPS